MLILYDLSVNVQRQSRFLTPSFATTIVMHDVDSATQYSQGQRYLFSCPKSLSHSSREVILMYVINKVPSDTQANSVKCSELE